MNGLAVNGFTWWKAAMAAAGITLLTAACGSSSTPSASPAPAASSPSGTPQATSAMCHDVAALRATVQKLTHLSVGPNTQAELTTDLKDVKAELTALASTAHSELSSQADALKSAVDKMQKELAATNISGMVSAFGGITTAGTNFLAAANAKCPASASSGT